MKESITVIGGTYFEYCIDPFYQELYGSGLRGAAALSGKDFDISLLTCLAAQDEAMARSICATYNIEPFFYFIEETVSFEYYHPLSVPQFYGRPLNNSPTKLPDYKSKNILFYGMIEASVKVHGEFVIYDPQNHVSFSATGSTADHLALVLNSSEAREMANSAEDALLEEVGEALRINQNAEIVVIKNGPHGAIVIEEKGISYLPVFETDHVWPIGSGDIFSAAFAWHWGLKHVSAYEAGMLASNYTGTYCNSQNLPLSEVPDVLIPIPKRKLKKKIYLAGPFFTISQRWLINEIRNILINMGSQVFSPLHDVGIATNHTNQKEHFTKIAKTDLDALSQSDIVFAILCDFDPGTSFEIGHAIALKKQVIIYSENIKESDLLMMYGTHCKISSELSTAIYTASW